MYIYFSVLEESELCSSLYIFVSLSYVMLRNYFIEYDNFRVQGFTKRLTADDLSNEHLELISVIFHFSYFFFFSSISLINFF